MNWIKIGDMPQSGNIVRSVSEKITPEGAKKSRKVEIGDIILSNSMSFGKPYIMGIPGYIHDGWFVIREYEKTLYKDYLCQLLSSDYVQKQYHRMAAGGVVLNISSDLVNSVVVPVPDLDEQQKIADFLSLVDERIEKQRQLVEVLKRYKRGFFQQIILGLDTTDFEVADVVKEYTEKTQTQNEYPILSSTLSGIQLQNSYFNKQAASENTVGYKIVPYGYFTYRSMSDTGDFRFNLQTIIDKGIVSPAYPVFSILDDHESEFVEYILNETDKIKNQLRIIKEGGTRYALSFAKFKSLTISLPTKQQQENFVNQLRLFNKLLSREETIYIDLQKYKSALLQQMFI